MVGLNASWKMLASSTWEAQATHCSLLVAKTGRGRAEEDQWEVLGPELCPLSQAGQAGRDCVSGPIRETGTKQSRKSFMCWFLAHPQRLIWGLRDMGMGVFTGILPCDSASGGREALI